jgi:hypothetical protein
MIIHIVGIAQCIYRAKNQIIFFILCKRSFTYYTTPFSSLQKADYKSLGYFGHTESEVSFRGSNLVFPENDVRNLKSCYN